MDRANELEDTPNRKGQVEKRRVNQYLLTVWFKDGTVHFSGHNAKGQALRTLESLDASQIEGEPYLVFGRRIELRVARKWTT